MNILVLEDRGSVSFYLEDALRRKGHRVFSAFSVADAQSYWDSERIDCIIADSNMNPDGLTQDEIDETEHGLLTGWTWLRNHVFAERKDMMERTIFYTDYLERVVQAIPPAELGGVHLLPKKGSASPAEQLLGIVEAMAQMVE
jgi:CheY-like chemotaxis protein